jgi:hypothetical protein
MKATEPPNPDEIEARAAAIRAEWSADEERRRRTGRSRAPTYRLPVYHVGRTPWGVVVEPADRMTFETSDDARDRADLEADE